MILGFTPRYTTYGNPASPDNTDTAAASQLGANGLNDLFGNYTRQVGGLGIANLLRFGEVDSADAAGQAAADTALAYQKAYDTAQRNYSRMGINPNSGRYAGMEQSFALNRAAAEAGARNIARIQARQQNFENAKALAGLGTQFGSLALNAQKYADGDGRGWKGGPLGPDGDYYKNELAKLQLEAVKAKMKTQQ